MAKYGQAAELASRLLGAKNELRPRDAWNAAVLEVFPDSPSSRAKGCPRDTFLALCEMGLIKNVPVGEYTQSVKNKGYTAGALAVLRTNPRMCDDEKGLWDIVTNGQGKTPNRQMEIVTSLWRKGLIAR